MQCSPGEVCHGALGLDYQRIPRVVTSYAQLNADAPVVRAIVASPARSIAIRKFLNFIFESFLWRGLPRRRPVGIAQRVEISDLINASIRNLCGRLFEPRCPSPRRRMYGGGDRIGHDPLVPCVKELPGCAAAHHSDRNADGGAPAAASLTVGASDTFIATLDGDRGCERDPGACRGRHSLA